MAKGSQYLFGLTMLQLRLFGAVVLAALVTFCPSVVSPLRAVEFDASSCKFFQYVNSDGATMIGYTPSQLDPRNPDNQVKLPTSSIKADLAALRPAFDGLVTYGYHEACTPRVLAVAKELNYRAVMIGIWQPKSAEEVDGVARLVEQYHDEMAVAVIIGNEGLIFNRYEEDDLRIAHARLRKRLPADVPLTTTEPLTTYDRQFVRDFGDFLAPNIHPVFDAPDLEAAKAVAWTNEHALKLAQQSGKSVLVKETGFPHAGKERYTFDTQRAFWSEYVSQPLLAKVEGKADWIFRGVAFEAFDLHWKSEASGLAIERSWGLMSAERKPHPAFEIWQAKVDSP